MSTNQWCFDHKFTDEDGSSWNCVISTKRWDHAEFGSHAPSGYDIKQLHEDFQLYVFAAYFIDAGDCTCHDETYRYPYPKEIDVISHILSSEDLQHVWYFDT